MIKKTLTYIDFNGNKRSEDSYFNVSKAELLEKQFDVDENGKEIQFTDVLTRIGEEKRPSELVRIFRMLIEWSYGVKSEDGRRFTKTPEVLAEFMESPAYSELYMELAQNADAASEFTSGILPDDMKQQVATQAANGFRPGFDSNNRPTPPIAGIQPTGQVATHVAERPFEVNDAQPQPGQYIAPPAPNQQ